MDETEERRTIVVGSLSAYVNVKFEPVGPCFRTLLLQRNRKSICGRGDNVDDDDDEDDNSDSTDSDLPLTNGGPVEDEVDDESNVAIEDDIDFLRSLDPKEWKDQDHYAVLGLGKLRRAASDGLIKKAYRKKVLTHHPDKRRSSGEKIRDADDDYFTCITRAYEVLGNPIKRQSYDSIDPEFDNTIPTVNANSKENFYKVFTDVFKRNERWSIKKRVPSLGNDESTFEEVNKFYLFWYDFSSWREFSYLDEEEKEKGETREERRWIEKQNKAARQKRKKEESARIRQLVDNAYACDPRVPRFKEDERQRKLALKRAKHEAIRAKAEEEEKIRQAALDLERQEKEKVEAENRAKAHLIKKERHAYKNLMNKERNQLRDKCKDFGYFTVGQAELATHLIELDKLCELLPLDSLQEFNQSLVNCDANSGRTIFLKRVKELNDQLHKDKQELFNSSQKSSASKNRSGSKNWAPDDVSLLIKAVNLYPAGTNQRWDVVADYMNQHSRNAGTVKRTAKEVLTKAKDLQKSNSALKEEANKEAFNKFAKTQKLGVAVATEEASPTERFESPAEMHGGTPWTADEQRLLEQALKTFPASTINRWDCISESVVGRTKKDCMKRYKDLVEIVKAKKAAAQVAMASKLKS